MPRFEEENLAPAPQTRREREEALIRQSRIFAESKSIMQELAAALEAAHRREDVIENPSDDFIRRIAEAVVEQRVNGVLSGQRAVKITPSPQTLNDVRSALAALAEAVR